MQNIFAACSQVLIISFVFLFAQVPASDPGLRKKTQNFKLRITEKGTSFDEQIEIDEDNDIEYFSIRLTMTF